MVDKMCKNCKFWGEYTEKLSIDVGLNFKRCLHHTIMELLFSKGWEREIYFQIKEVDNCTFYEVKEEL